MKKILAIISLFTIAVLFDSCNKKENQFEPNVAQTSSIVTTPTQTTSIVTTPTQTTSVNDTVNKTKVVFNIGFIDVITQPFDYQYDTINTRVRLNQTRIVCDKIINYNVLTGYKRDEFNPIWMATGDSLVVEFDSLEYNGNIANYFNVLYGGLTVKLLGKNNYGNTIVTKETIVEFNDKTITVSDMGTDHKLGYGRRNGTGGLNPWFVHKGSKFIYVKD